MTSSNGNIFRVTGLLCGEFTGEFPAQKPVTRSFDVSLICAWIKGWVNNCEAGDLRRRRAHYDVTEMLEEPFSYNRNQNIPFYTDKLELSWWKTLSSLAAP